MKLNVQRMVISFSMDIIGKEEEDEILHSGCVIDINLQSFPFSEQ